MALSHVPVAVDRLVLWVLADEFGVDHDADTALDDRIGDRDWLSVGIDDLDRVDVPVGILVGTEDRGASVEDCERVADAVNEGDVTEVPGENHSFDQNRTTIVEGTLSYLTAEE